MARVLVAANSSWNLQNFRSGLLRALVREGHEVLTLSPDAEAVKINESFLPHRTCPMERSGTNPLKDLACLGRLVRIIGQERPDILLGFTIKPNIYGGTACRLLGVPAVPNVSGLGTAFLGSSSFRRAVLHLYRLAFGGAKAVFFQNPDDQQFFLDERVVRPGQSKVLPGSGVDLTHFSASELPAELNILMIARLLGDKGVREYAEAARMLKARFPSAKFSLLGELDTHNRSAIAEGELEEWVAEGIIDYLGATSDVRPFIRDATAIVLPSYREGLPRTLLEGAAMGRPLIGTDVPGCREVVRNGTTGFICEAKSAESLAAAMERFANAPPEERSRMGAAAREMVEAEFDERLVFAAYLDVIRDLSI